MKKEHGGNGGVVINVASIAGKTFTCILCIEIVYVNNLFIAYNVVFNSIRFYSPNIVLF
jgi:hypothetical protein